MPIGNPNHETCGWVRVPGGVKLCVNGQPVGNLIDNAEFIAWLEKNNQIDPE